MNVVPITTSTTHGQDSANTATPPILRRIPIAARTWLKTSFVRRWLMSYRHRDIRAADVFLASYPKSGNTWLRHLLTYVATGESTKWRGESLNHISGSVGRQSKLPRIATNNGRLIKTHEPYRNAYKRAVLLVRDPRDVVVSEYYFRRSYSEDFYRYNDDFKTFVDVFLSGKTGGYGNWAQHTASWFEAQRLGQCELLIVPFERFKADTAGEARKIVDFIGLKADDALISAAVEDSGIESMKRKEDEFWKSKGLQSPNFVRGGKTGGWRDLFDRSMEEDFWKVMGDVAIRAGYQRLAIEGKS
jgi:hypothetical protein